MDLTQDDIIQILKMIDEAPFGRVHLQLDKLTLEVVKGDGLRSPSIAVQPLAPASEQRAVPPPKALLVAGDAVARDEVPAAAGLAIDEGLPKITAPILGTFYRRPQPGAPPYVEEGSLVEEDTTVALIEVMKLFNPVKAGQRGRIHRICVENGQLVEFGQTLFVLQPE